MNLISTMSKERNMLLICSLYALSFLKIIFLGLTSYFTPKKEIAKECTAVGLIIILDNLFLADGIASKNVTQLCYYPIIYCYAVILNCLEGSNDLDWHLIFKAAQIVILVIKGVIVVRILQDYKVEFAWYHFKKLGPSTRLNGK